MKKLIILITTLFITLLSIAQDPAYPAPPAAATSIVRLEYFFDTDPGFGLATALSITNALDVNGSYNISLAGLANGVHRLYVRSRNASGAWGLVSYQEFFIDYNPTYPTAPAAATNMVKQEYFFDTDPGFGLATNIPITAGVDVSSSYNLNPTGLSNGVHRVYVRSRDASGNWSLTNVSDFLIDFNPPYPIAYPAAVNITAQEYFIDADPGFGLATPISTTPGLDVSGTYAINVAGLTAGIHRMYYRSKDVGGRWSLTNFSQFTVDADPAYPSPYNALTNLTQLEYFIDADPGFGQATPVPFSPTTNLASFNFNVNLSTVVNGLHYLYTRSYSNGFSLTNVSPFMLGPVLPLNWLGIAAKAYAADSVQLSWKTANELNNKTYVVERSADGKNFAPIAMVAANVVPLPTNQYAYTDAQPLGGTSYYRIKQVDKDGKYTYSPIVAIRINSLQIFVAAVQPNPFVNAFTVTIQSKEKTNASLALINAGGHTIATQNVLLEAGSNSFKMDGLEKFAAGTYLLRIGNGQQASVLKLAKQ